MKADPATFKLTGYKLAETKERFAWKKRSEWMPVDLPWPPPGKQLIFSYKLDDEVISVLAANSVSDASRPVLFVDNFEKQNNQWSRFESKADARNSFINEGKPGEIMALANTAVFADREIQEGAVIFMAKINPGTDKSSSWGPGIGLVFENKVVKINLRPGKNEFGFYEDDEEEKIIPGMSPGNAVWLRFARNGEVLTGSYSYDKQNWTIIGKALVNGKPVTFRVGKMDRRGRGSDSPEKGDQGRCQIESVEFLGNQPANQLESTKFNYLKNIELTVHYELYDGMPVFSKWIELVNHSSKKITLNTFKSEILAVTEAESVVDPKKRWLLPNITLETDYNFGGMTNESLMESSITWTIDPLYKTQVNYERTTLCLLEVYPKIGPGQELAPNSKFTSYRVWELLHDSQAQERKGLEHRRMMRAMAPWATENPILMHVRSASDEAVKKAIDQCAEVGFEMVIMTFGSGFNAEDPRPETLERMKKLASYAHSKGIALGGYSLLASRKINAENDVVMPEGKTPRFGNSPCLESQWGHDYFENLYNLYEKTGLDILEHDGSYPGDICASETHPGHKGLHDSQWNQYQSSHPGEFHPEVLTEPDVKVSLHPAPLVQKSQVRYSWLYQFPMGKQIGIGYVLLSKPIERFILVQSLLPFHPFE